ncbi:MAG: 30S ribosomal protein S9 [Candidatus Woesearchaeota archaeon]|jgi:small subunit ribosomal protein S9
MSKITQTSGKRKRAIARATLRAGKGIVLINNKQLNTFSPEMIKLRIQEPLLLADKLAEGIDIDIRVSGGGATSQADASRLAIARGLVAYTNSSALKNTFLEYDRQLLVADIRRKENAKPNSHGQARAKVQKSYR